MAIFEFTGRKIYASTQTNNIVSQLQTIYNTTQQMIADRGAYDRVAAGGTAPADVRYYNAVNAMFDSGERLNYREMLAALDDLMATWATDYPELLGVVIQP